MEELNLGDLDFDTSAFDLFDVESGEIDKTADPLKPAEDITETANAEVSDDETINTDSDDLDGQESVANQGKDKISQVQADKTAGAEGGNSSSPKLNETEQLYSQLATQLKAKGVLSGLDEKELESIKSLDDINAAVKKQIEFGLTEQQRLIKEAQEAGVPIKEVVMKVQTVDKLKAIQPEFIKDAKNLEFRRTAIIQDFISKGYNKERATALAQRSIDAGTDVEDANFAIKAIIEHEEKQISKLVDDAKNEEKNRLNDLKSYISSTKEVVPGIELTDSQKDELYNQITTDLGNKDNAFMQAQKKDPIGSRVKLEAIFFLTKGLTDFSVFGQKSETKISKSIENLLRGAKFTEEGTIQTSIDDRESNFKLSDLKDLEIE